MTTERPIHLVLTTMALVALWQGLALVLGPTILPGPAVVFARAGEELATLRFWEHVWASTRRLAISLTASFLTGVPVGLLVGTSRRLDRFFSPIIFMSYPIPKIVFLPVILVLFGLGDLSKVVLISLITFFQLLITCRDSARQISREAVYSLRSLGGSRWHLFRHVIWPVSLPGIFTALRIGSGTGVAVLFFAESIATTRGLGLYIIDLWGRADYPGMYVGIMALSALGMVLYEVFELLERFYCPWRRA